MKLISSSVTLQVVFLTTSLLIVGYAWTKETQPQAQPLAGLDKMLKQANGVKLDAIIDNKLASNVTNALNDMAQNLRKMFIENRRLTMQVQELVNRVQNATGVNARALLEAFSNRPQTYRA